MRQGTTIIEIGTSKIVVLVFEKGQYDQSIVLGSAVEAYPGFRDRHWMDKRAVLPAILKAVKEAEKQAGVKTHTVHLAVPSDFTKVVCAYAELDFGAKRPVTNKDITELYRIGRTKLNISQEYSVIHRCPVTFVLDSMRRTMEPVGEKAGHIKAIVSYVLVEKWFSAGVEKALSKHGMDVSTMISTSYAQTMRYIPDDARDSGAVLVDIGHYSTTVCTVRGDGILFHGILPLGGAMITKDIATVFGLQEDMAEELKHRSIYGLSLSEEDFYEVSDKDHYKFYRFSALEVQAVIEARLSELFELVAKVIEENNKNLPDYAKVFITGGTASMRGLREFAQKTLDRNIVLIQPQATRLNKPCYSAALAVMDMALDVETVEDTGFFNGFFGLFKK